MEGRTIKQDYDEFDLLLGEIPDATSGNSHEEFCPTNAPASLDEEGKVSSSGTSINLHHSPHAAKHWGDISFSGNLNFTGSPFYHTIERNQKIDHAKSGYKTNVMNANQDESNLPDDESLTSAYANLSFKDGVEVKAAHVSVTCDRTLCGSNLPFGSHHLNCLRKSLSGLNSVDMSTPPNTLNGFNLVSPTLEAYAPSVSRSGVDKLSLEINNQDKSLLKLGLNELEKEKTESLLPHLEDQLQSLPVYSATMPLVPTMHTFHMLPVVSVPGVEFPASAYQQHYHLDGQSPAYFSSQHFMPSHMTWQNVQDGRCCRTHQQYFFLQQIQNQRPEFLSVQRGTNATVGSINGNLIKPYFETSISHQIEQTNHGPYWNEYPTHHSFNHLGTSLVGSSLCQYNDHGFCEKGERCAYVHGHKQTHAGDLTYSCKDFKGVHVLDKVGKKIFPERILTRSHGLNSLRTLKTCSLTKKESSNHADFSGKVFSNAQIHHPPNLTNKSFQMDGWDSQCSSLNNFDLRKTSKTLMQKYNTVDDVVGRIYIIAKDQNGCRFLQRKFQEGNPEDVQKIFAEIISHIVELMTDGFGNYLVQKLLDVCNEQQRMHILRAITRNAGELIRISCDPHGTRAVQKVIETLKTPEQFTMIVSSLRPGIVSLMKNINGNHVAQHCLQYLLPEYSEFLFDAAICHCVELATNRHGCCVLQKCISYVDRERKNLLMAEIVSNSLVLSQDPYGNYVVQHILDHKVRKVIDNVLVQLDGNFVDLSTQKYSSNVVEKCLRVAPDWCARITHELMNSSRFTEVMQDPYGNFVIQSALIECKGHLHAALVEAIRPHIPALRSSPYGKKILSSNCLMK